MSIMEGKVWSEMQIGFELMSFFSACTAFNVSDLCEEFGFVDGEACGGCSGVFGVFLLETKGRALCDTMKENKEKKIAGGDILA
ncbi:hypothetical protein SESBI_08205 [Sesbania bispinosa]|nr:hypothetical protein SESBI_08205 [Sesbania bispinosa]